MTTEVEQLRAERDALIVAVRILAQRAVPMEPDSTGQPMIKMRRAALDAALDATNVRIVLPIARTG